MDNYIAGIDEAGRGSVIGGLWMAIVATQEPDILKEIGAKDSKQLTKEKREKLYPLIEENCIIKTKRISPEEIDCTNLNKLEITTAIQLIIEMSKEININEIYIDALSANCNKDTRYILNNLELDNLEIIIEPKADDTYPIVGAASIIAKVNRDNEIQRLNIPGCGYPSDNATCNYIKKYYKENNCFPPYTRTKWSTIKKMIKIQF